MELAITLLVIASAFASSVFRRDSWCRCVCNRHVCWCVGSECDE